ncbi:dopamine N-acetyltransferase-like [Scaptodrosophila lebanonensis]|uniref:aralkylamine N-acetyltransferase n=1 Tax=Drosophila lebanonensis TaxID=7225 RepID=A0A6J2TQX5_DROLE|nr:dopamine N-acetyltransferase-like [Scaptodrosophila lebanonensis]
MSSKTEDSIKIRTMTVDDFKEIKPFLREHLYTGEPLTMSSNEDAEKCDEKNTDEYNLKLIKQGTSLVAVEPSGRIVGLVLAGALYPSDFEKNRVAAETAEQHVWGRLNRLLSVVERQANFFERYGASKAIYSHITNVHSSMRGKGLGSRLAAALMDVGRAKGFPLMVAYCTSFYSARQKQALGMEVAYSLPYADYKDEEGRVIFHPPAPHDAIRVMVMRL